jgi:hypothetical protein
VIRLTTALLTLGAIMATATVTAQAQGECWWVGCNLEAPWCRFYCGTDDPRQTEIDPGSQWQSRPAGVYPRHRYHRHAKHHNGRNSSG